MCVFTTRRLLTLRFIFVHLVALIPMSASFGNPPRFANDAEAIEYCDAQGIVCIRDPTQQYVEQVWFDDDSPDVDGVLDRLSGLTHAPKLYYQGNTASVERIRALSVKFPQIEQLQIEDTGHVSVAVYEQLKELKNLRSFSRNCPLIIDPKNVPEIVSRHGPDRNGRAKMRAIFALEQLESLYLDQMTLGGVDFSPIERFKNLETLTLDETGLTDPQLLHVGRLTNLTWLSLARTKVTDVGVKHLENLQQLGYLCLWENPGITDKSAPSLLTLRRLEDLEIMDTEIGDEALRVLAAHPSLKKLSVDGTWITDEGLSALAELSVLESLGVETTRVTQEGVDRLRKALPNCHIETNPPEYMGWDRTKF